MPFRFIPEPTSHYKLSSVAKAFELFGLTPFVTATKLQNFNYCKFKRYIVALALDNSFCHLLSFIFFHLSQARNIHYNKKTQMRQRHKAQLDSEIMALYLIQHQQLINETLLRSTSKGNLSPPLCLFAAGLAQKFYSPLLCLNLSVVGQKTSQYQSFYTNRAVTFMFKLHWRVIGFH